MLIVRLILRLILLIGLITLVVIAVRGLMRYGEQLYGYASNAIYRFRHEGYFGLDSAMGLSSDNFDVASNIERQDGRRGLNVLAKVKIRYNMFRHGLSFDEARLMSVQDDFERNSIDQDGRPRDPKAVFFTERTRATSPIVVA